MNTSVMFENLTIEEFKMLLHFVVVPILSHPLKENTARYFNKEVAVDSLSREAIEELYIKHVYKKRKDMTLAIHLTNQVIELINQDGVSEEYAAILRKKHNNILDDEFKKLVKEVMNKKARITIAMFFKMLGEDELDVSRDTLHEVEENAIPFLEETIERSTPKMTQSLVNNEFLSSPEVIPQTTSIAENREDDLFDTMDYIDQTIKNFRKEINEIGKMTNKEEIVAENNDSEDFQKLKREKNLLSMELNKNKIKVLTLESQLDQAIYSMKAYAKRVEEIVSELVVKQDTTISQSKVMEAMHCVNSYKEKHGIPGSINVHQLWLELSKIEEDLISKLIYNTNDVNKSRHQLLNTQLQDTIKVKEALQTLISISKR